MSERRSIASKPRPIDPAAITPSGQLGDLHREATGRPSPFSEHTPPAFAPPSAYFPPSQGHRPVQLTAPEDWQDGDWPEEVQGDWGFTTE